MHPAGDTALAICLAMGLASPPRYPEAPPASGRTEQPASRPLDRGTQQGSLIEACSIRYQPCQPCTAVAGWRGRGFGEAARLIGPRTQTGTGIREELGCRNAPVCWTSLGDKR